MDTKYPYEWEKSIQIGVQPYLVLVESSRKKIIIGGNRNGSVRISAESLVWDQDLQVEGREIIKPIKSLMRNLGESAFSVRPKMLVGFLFSPRS